MASVVGVNVERGTAVGDGVLVRVAVGLGVEIGGVVPEGGVIVAVGVTVTEEVGSAVGDVGCKPPAWAV